MNVNRHGKPLGTVGTPRGSGMFNDERRIDDDDNNNRKKDGGKILNFIQELH